MKTRITRVTVHANKIRGNAKHGTNEPVVRAQTGGKVFYGHEVVIEGPSKVVYSPDKPLKCGAKVWVETTSPVRVDGQVLFPRADQCTVA